MSRAWIALLLLPAPGAWGDVSPFFENPATAIPRLGEGPTMDGVLQDSAWRSAGRLTEFRDYQSGEPAKLRTVVLAGYDRENLYIAFECREPDVERMDPGGIADDTLALFAVDHIEVFIKTAPTSDTYYHFAVEAFGARYEAKREDPSWTPQWRSASAIGEGVWCVEVAIPWDAIAEERPTFLLANFCRSRRIEPGETSCWSPTFGLFHNPARFGSVALGEPPALSVASPVISEVSRGRHDVSASVGATAETGLELMASVHVKTGKRLSVAAARKARIPPGESLMVSIPVRFRDAYNGPVVIVIRAAATRELLWFTGPQPVSLRGTRGLKVARAVSGDLSPALRWVETERLRACCYGFPISPLPELDLHPLPPDPDPEPQPELTFRGEGIIRAHVAEGEELRFRITAGTPGSLFSSSTYAVFAPDGTHLADGIVEQGQTEEVALPAEQEGLHMLLLNSGPASDNCVALQMRSRSWVVDGRGRSAYRTTLVGLNSLRDLSLAGFNTAFLGSWNWGMEFATDEGLDAWVRNVALWAEAAERYHMRLIPYVGWACAGNEVQAAGEYRKTLSTREVDGPRPCPLSEEYWERTFLRRALAVARLSEECPSIIGFGLDPESYYFSSWYTKAYEEKGVPRPTWGQTTFFSHDECFCDRCFLGFLESQGLQRPEVAADGKARFDWLEGRDVSGEYYEYLADELRALTARLREKVHAVNPHMAFAVMLLGSSDSYWCRGVSRGLGTPRLPVFDYDEATYTVGFTPAVEQHKKRFERWGAHVLHGGTLWGGKHPPQDPHFLSAQMYQFAVRDGGYWFWPGSSSLWLNQDQPRGFYALAGFQEDYWRALVHANREIDRKLEEPGRYASELDAPRRAPPPGEVDEQGRNVWGRKPSYALRVKSGTTLAFHVPENKSRFTFIWGLREGSGDWKIIISSPGSSISERRFVSAEQGEEIAIDVPPDEQGEAWTVQVERVGEDGGDHLGIGLRGLPPFFSSHAETLLVSQSAET